MIPLFKVFQATTAGDELLKTLYSGFVGQGPQVERFEVALQDYLQQPYVLTVNSCTSALQLALHLVGAGEVLTTPLTCFATTAAILNSGLKPRWVDVDLQTLNMDLDDLERKLQPETRVVLIVHFAGYPLDLERLDRILDAHASRYGRQRPWVIEDCAHAFGAKRKGNYLGGPNLCCFSFQAVKTLNTGDGGLLTLPNKLLYRRAKRLRWFGLDRDLDRSTQDISEVGFKYHMNDLAATIGLANLPQIETLLSHQRANYHYYHEQLSEWCFESNSDCDPTAWIFPLRVPDQQDFIRSLAAQGIASSPVHVRNDQYSCVSKERLSLPQMDILEREMTCIPSGWWVTPDNRERIVAAVKSASRSG